MKDSNLEVMLLGHALVTAVRTVTVDVFLVGLLECRGIREAGDTFTQVVHYLSGVINKSTTLL